MVAPAKHLRQEHTTCKHVRGRGGVGGPGARSKDLRRNEGQAPGHIGTERIRSHTTAEIDDLHLQGVRVDANVFGFYVSVGDALIMTIGNRVAHLLLDAPADVEWQWANSLSIHVGKQILPTGLFHPDHDVRRAVQHLDLPGDVRMLQLAMVENLAPQGRGLPDSGYVALRDELHGLRLAALRVHRAQHTAEAASAEFVCQLAWANAGAFTRAVLDAAIHGREALENTASHLPEQALGALLLASRSRRVRDLPAHILLEAVAQALHGSNLGLEPRTRRFNSKPQLDRRLRVENDIVGTAFQEFRLHRQGGVTRLVVDEGRSTQRDHEDRHHAIRAS
mmetsp:Transcript_43667/g.127078  ORF Transcript_43667/g.127078 Transcript_43667/m.127078 type:complete len:336 (+) Transcript_43667:343-1350(+)